MFVYKRMGALLTYVPSPPREPAAAVGCGAGGPGDPGYTTHTGSLEHLPEGGYAQDHQAVRVGQLNM